MCGRENLSEISVLGEAPGQQFFIQFFFFLNVDITGEIDSVLHQQQFVFFFFPPSPPYICKRRLIKRLNKRSLLVNLQETKPSTCDASKRPRATSLPQKSQLSAADWKIKSPVHKNFTPIVMQ